MTSTDSMPTTTGPATDGAEGAGGGARRTWQVHNHRDVSGGWARASVFGVSDGLVSNTALILGVAGASPDSKAVIVAGLAGLIAGAVSMAAGEYVSMQAQKELLERELSIEADAIAAHPEAERRELVNLYRSRGVDRPTAEAVATQLMADSDLALEVHAREELGLDPEQTGAPLQAAGASLVAFAGGAIVPLVPWLFGGGTAAIVVSLALAVVTAALVGGFLARFTERSITRSSTRQVLITLFSCAVTYGIGSLVGASV